jgi:hypothetical protein
MLEAQGFTRYCEGRFLAVPALSLQSEHSQVKVVMPNGCPEAGLEPYETELLSAHAILGCLSVTCTADDGGHPFVFLPLAKAAVVPYAYLAYCRHLRDFVRFAGPLGRLLAQRGLMFVVVDSNGPMKGLIGRYYKGYPKYFRGPNKPRLGDLSYSERVFFGF